MWNVVLDLVSLVAGIALLVVGADLLIQGAARIARKVGVSSFVVGLTVVAFGTSAPELAAGIGFVLSKQSDMAAGAVIGSNVANIGFILGVTALVRPISCRARYVQTDAPIMVGVSLMGAFLMVSGRHINWIESAVLASCIVLYVVRAYLAGKSEDADLAHTIEQDLEEELGLTEHTASQSWLRVILFVMFGMAALTGGTRLLVSGAESLAVLLGVPGPIISISLVAFGTSLPELAASVRAAMKNDADIAIGNVLGSNVFNVLSVLGISGLVGRIDITGDMWPRDIMVMVIFAFAVLPIMNTGGRVSRREGLLLLMGYLGYVAWIY